MGEFSTLAGTRPFFAAPLPHRSISHMVGVGPSGTFDERSSPPLFWCFVPAMIACLFDCRTYLRSCI
uniref:Uncharacterized protein n=1 Tax=Helianthus annuus TaxID=4232 RepID=A0A2P1MA68_HELAN|nr:hypothetical protein [Helianthus annuus]AVP27563.1 hypothetical protein [Helianthus annuus]